MKNPARIVALAAFGCVTLSLASCNTEQLGSAPPKNPEGQAQSASAQQQASKAVLAKADPQMKAVLDQLQALNPKPLEGLSPQEARQQPSAADAATKVMEKKGIKPDNSGIAKVAPLTIQGPADAPTLPVRVYTPEGAGPFPVIVYYHGGGWVIASVDTYDASARALCKMANAVVVSVGYRQAPEHQFPAAHEDSYAALQWAAKNAQQVNGDAKRVAVAGESAGGNLAAAVCLMAKERGGAMPVHQLLVYPIAGYDFDTESYRENADAKPLNKAGMQWFFKHYLPSPSDGQNKLISLVRASAQDLNGLPPATVITDQIDPLRSEGKQYADNLKAAGVDIAYRNYDGVTHEFFGMGPIVDKAKDAEQFAADRLKASLSK